MKNIVLISLVILFTGVLLRGSIYRSMVSYKPLYERATYNISDTKSPLSVDKAIEHSLDLTSVALEFDMQTSNCIHYAKLFTQLCNELLPDDWKATHQVGHLYLLGYNVHDYINYRGFKDHDFVIIMNEKTGERYAVDPSLNDYSGINYITIKP